MQRSILTITQDQHAPKTAWYETYIRDTEEGYEEGRNNDEEGEQLSVLVEEFELIDQPRDHRLHPAHLQGDTQESEQNTKSETVSCWGTQAPKYPSCYMGCLFSVLLQSISVSIIVHKHTRHLAE